MGELSKCEDEWQRRATAAAVAAARRVVKGDAAIPANTSVGRLSDAQWGWLVAAALFAWIGVRAEQATAEGLDVEPMIRDGCSDAWDAGAIATILPKLAETPDIEWSSPLAEWPPETMVHFVATALRLTLEAMAARDHGPGVTRTSAVPLSL
jgi:hypothetical protein